MAKGCLSPMKYKAGRFGFLQIASKGYLLK